MHRGTAPAEKEFIAMTVRVPTELMERMRARLAQDGVKFQGKVLGLIEEYVASEPEESEHQRRMRLAEEELERFRTTFEILSK